MSRTRWIVAGAAGVRGPLCALSVFFAFALVAAACGGDDGDGDSAEPTTSAAESATATDDMPEDTEEEAPKEGPVTIANQVDFEFRPVAGTFEVTEGADILGCSSGAFVDAGSPTEGIQRVYTCDSGPKEGSFTASFNFLAEANTVSDSGTWTVLEGSDDFVDLPGEGDWSIVYAEDDSDIGDGTWTGEINYAS